MIKSNKRPSFTWRGKANTEMGVRLLSMPTRFVPARSGSQVEVAGRDGYIWVDDGSYSGSQIRIEVVVDDYEMMDSVTEWLSGEGLLVFSDDPERAWKARVIKEINVTPKTSRLTAQMFTISFDAQPYRYMYPELPPVNVTNGSNLNNVGTMTARPKITVTPVRSPAAGASFQLIVGQYVVYATNLKEAAIIDCEMQEVYSTADVPALLNVNFDMDEFPVLEAGYNPILWQALDEEDTPEDEKTEITVKITRPWRFL